MSKLSKKSLKRKTSSSKTTASIVALLSDTSDNICSVCGPDLNILSTQISRILQLCSNESSERKALMHKSSSGLGIILKALKVADSGVVVSDVISLLRVLTEHNYTAQLVRRSVVSAVMVSLSDTHKSSWNSDPLLLLHMSLLNKLSTSDKKFAVKARLSGVLSIVIGLLKKYQDGQEKLFTILKLLHNLSTSSINADSLGKLGCVGILVKLLVKSGQTDYLLLKLCINVLIPLFKQKVNANRPAAQTCVRQLVLLHEQLHHTDVNSRHILLRKKVLHCLKTCISRDVNLQVFRKSSGIQVLYTTALQSSEGGHKDPPSIISLTCLVLRKALPFIPLPLASLENPTSFSLPIVQLSKVTENLISGSSSAKSTNSDISASLETCDKTRKEEENEEESSPANAMGSSNSEADFSSNSDYNSTSHLPESIQECSDADYLSSRVSATAEKSYFNLDEFTKFFPELEGSPYLHSLSDKEPTEKANPPVVVVPTAVPTTSSKSDTVNGQQELGEFLFNTAVHFVEEPAPQVMGHIPPTKPEPVYHKFLSADRRLYLSDIARIAKPRTIIDKTVFDLDTLIASSPGGKLYRRYLDHNEACQSEMHNSDCIPDSTCQRSDYDSTCRSVLETHHPDYDSTHQSGHETHNSDYDSTHQSGLERHHSECDSTLQSSLKVHHSSGFKTHPSMGQPEDLLQVESSMKLGATSLDQISMFGELSSENSEEGRPNITGSRPLIMRHYHSCPQIQKRNCRCPLIPKYHSSTTIRELEALQQLSIDPEGSSYTESLSDDSEALLQVLTDSVLRDHLKSQASSSSTHPKLEDNFVLDHESKNAVGNPENYHPPPVLEQKNSCLQFDFEMKTPTSPKSNPTQAPKDQPKGMPTSKDPKSLLQDLEWENENFASLVRVASAVNKVTDPPPVTSPHLLFESRFESGNLRKAIQVRQYEYDLLLNADINTTHHHQWFYFKVSNNKPGVTYRFNIINCEKPSSQFNYGMQPLMFSRTAFQLNHQGWVRTGTKVSYYSNNFGTSGENVGPLKKRKNYYTMTFSIVFQHDNDTCYFAYHYPYTYSMLLYDLKQIEENVKEKDMFYHKQSLCTTLCGNSCPLVTITGPKYDYPSKLADPEKEEKKYVVISSRVHPGESNASWIMRGLLCHLTSNHPNAHILRDKFVFKIIPMLNPDGVIHGSHRCSLSGNDLNRQWISPSPSLYPTIYCTKALLHWLVSINKRPEVFCDFHGHSRRKNIFMYGCKDPSGSCIEQVLPYHLDKIAPFFSKSCCSFHVEKSKEATARVVVWKELGVAQSYTMESTYCGADQGQHKGRQIGTGDLEEMGTLFCAGLQRLDEFPRSGGIDYGAGGSMEYMSCHSNSSSEDDEDPTSSPNEGMATLTQ